MNFINNYIGLSHFTIVLILIVLMIGINRLFNKIEFKNIIISLISINVTIFYSYLFISGNFDSTINLPIEMCYITQILIFFYFIFDLHKIKPLLFFNSITGAIAGYLNTNMTANDHFIYHFHHYLAHSILLIFFLYMIHKKYRPTYTEFINSIIMNFAIFFSICIFNQIFATNYWFTMNKPPGTNLTLLFPEHPWYLIIMISIGILVYCITYFSFSNNSHE